MKRSTTKRIALLACMLLTTGMMPAQETRAEKQLISSEIPVGLKLVPMKPENFRLPVNRAEHSQSQKVIGTVKPAALTPADLSGSWIVQSPSMSPGQIPDAGNSVEIALTDEKTISIKKFWDESIELKATVDLEKGTIAIPHQKVFTNDIYGDCDIRWVAIQDGKIVFSKEKEISGTISAEGIELADAWGIFVTSGKDANNFFGIYRNSTFVRGNAIMSTDERDNSHYEYPVRIEQKSDNLLTVLNFANYGRTIEIVLNEDKSFSIASQLAFENTQYGAFYTYAADWETGKTGVFIYGTGDEHTLNWGPWLIQSEKVYIGNHINGKISTDLTIKYPTLAVDKFEGEGTEADPYLIKGIDELVLLAHKVNTDKELNYGTANKHTKTYLGKYFRVENDIDLGAVRIEPIGKLWSQCFAGTFDGNGKTITGINLSTDTGIAGLFGRVDTAGVIKNVVLDKVKIQASGSWVGGLAGWCLGTIENCHVTGEIQNQSKMTGGVAGRATNLSGCTFSGTVVGLDGCVGGIVGEIDGRMSNSFSDAIVIATSNSSTIESCGGIAGAMYLEDSSVSNCYFAGTVTTSGPNPLYLGGIVGNCYKGSISQCYNVGTVAGSGAQGASGGIVGYLIGNLTDSYNSGRVTQSACRSVGGIVGGINDNRNIMTGELIAHSVLRNCYTAGTVVAETSSYQPETETRETIGSIQNTAVPVIENIYYDKQMIDFGSRKYGVLTGELTSAKGPEGFSDDVWNFEEGYYPRLKSLSTGAVADLSVSVISLDTTVPDNVYKVTQDFSLNLAGDCLAGFYLDEGNGQGALHSKGHAASLQDGKSVQLTGNGIDTLFIANGKYSRSYILTITSTSVFEGEGTKASPFLIQTKEDLIKLSEFTGSELKQSYRDTYFRMTNNIDLEYDEAFEGINIDPKDANHQFAGHFDGGGYTIHRMKLTGVAWKITPEDAEDGWGTPDNTGGKGNMGFIGRLGAEGSISNLNMAEDCQLNYWGTSGAFVGINYGGRIENCKNYADINCYSTNVGGICGENSRLGAGVIRNCYNAGNIRGGYTTVAGIVGVNAGTVENCQNDGAVTVEKMSTFQANFVHAIAGGIVGTMNAGGEIALKNNVNTGMVTGKKRVGGICGFMSISGNNAVVDISNNINYGTIFTEEVITRGALIGEFSASCSYTLSDNYYDHQLLPYGGVANAPMEGVNGVETSGLVQASIPNFPAEIWSMSENRYPVLKAFASETKAVIASQTMVKIKAGENAGNLKSEITLSAPAEVSWSLKQGNVFVLNGTTIRVPASTDKVVSDTLVATSSGLTRAFILSKLPEIPLAGQGTEDHPYLIENAADWNALAQYIPDTYQTLEGLFIQITNDIDFADQEFIPMAGDGITAFEGTLNGNQKTLNNIHFEDSAQGYLGLFGTIGNKGTVSDLTIGSGSISSTKAHIGGFAGIVAGTLKNCINKARISTTSNYAGGMAALVKTNGVLINCVNYGEIHAATGYAAGIAAESEAGVNFNACGNEGAIIGTATLGGIVAKANAGFFDECYNKGTVTATKATAGGIVGTASGKEEIRIFRSFNTADISATNNAAGIVGTASSTPSTIDNCYNAGNITTSATGSSAGTAGIIGVIAPASTISNCYNTGNVTAEKCAYTGGITGYAGAAKEETPIYIKACHNEGNISALANYGGGICGGMTNFMTIEGCYNIGSVEGTFYIGGISSNLGGNYNYLINCWNAGPVTAQKNAAGGLFGTGNYSATITNCFNTGTISSTGADEKTAYQIGGLAGLSKAAFVNCYNSGRIDGKKQIGGLVGQAFNGSINKTSGVITYGTCFDHCYNTGEVTKLDTLSGNFVGDVNGKMWQYNIAEEVYALNEQPMESDSIASLISAAEMSKLDLGESWIQGDNYTFPILASGNNEYSKVAAAAVILSGDDKLTNVTKNFFVGTPENIIWSSSSGALTIEGNKVTVKSGSKEEVTLTATAGDVSKDVNIKLNTPTGIEESTADGKVIIKEEFYTVSGIKLTEKQMERGKIYVVVKTYEDGSTKKVKEMY